VMMLPSLLPVPRLLPVLLATAPPLGVAEANSIAGTIQGAKKLENQSRPKCF